MFFPRWDWKLYTIQLIRNLPNLKNVWHSISGNEGLNSLSQSELNCCYWPALELARQCCEALCVHAGGIICSFHYSNSYLTIFLASCYPTVGFKMHVCINRTVTDTLHKLLSITTSRMRFFSSAGCSCKYAFGSFITPLTGRFLTYCPRHCTASCHWGIYTSTASLRVLYCCSLCRCGQQGHIRLGAAGEKVGFKAVWGRQERASWVEVVKQKRKEGRQQECFWRIADNNMELARRKNGGRQKVN